LQGLSWRKIIPSEEDSIAVMHAAITAGCNIFNGGEMYGTPEYNSLTLLKAYYEKYPEDVGKVVVNIKSGTKGTFGLDGSAEYAKESVDRCLKLLGDRGKIDIFEYARRDTSVPLTVTLGALAECVEEGKIGGVALSEVNANTIREAAKITKIVAVETELSIFSTGPLNNGICAACAELGIQIHA
jgi:pyridoxine 4-dehydrogenase